MSHFTLSHFTLLPSHPLTPHPVTFISPSSHSRPSPIHFPEHTPAVYVYLNFKRGANDLPSDQAVLSFTTISEGAGTRGAELRS